MNRISPASRLVRIAARSPVFSIDGSGGDADRRVHLAGDDVGQRRLAQTRRAVEQHVVERLAALPRPPR